MHEQIAIGHVCGAGLLPLIERLRVKSLEEGAARELLLTTQYADLSQVEDEFWQAFEGLDTKALQQDTLALLEARGAPLTMADLAQALPPGEHDLETLAQWLAWACEAGAEVDAQAKQQIELQRANGQLCRFTVPRAELTASALRGVES